MLIDRAVSVSLAIPYLIIYVRKISQYAVQMNNFLRLIMHVYASLDMEKLIQSARRDVKTMNSGMVKPVFVFSIIQESMEYAFHAPLILLLIQLKIFAFVLFQIKFLTLIQDNVRNVHKINPQMLKRHSVYVIQVMDLLDKLVFEILYVLLIPKT